MLYADIPASIDRDALCKAHIEIVAVATKRQVVPTGTICTFFLDDTGQNIESVPYTERPIDPVISDRIRFSKKTKPVSKAMKVQAQVDPPMKISEDSLHNYIVQNPGNELVIDEIRFTEAIGYVTEVSHYLAIPFPNGYDAQGVFFLFLKNSEELKIANACCGKITAEIENLFS